MPAAAPSRRGARGLLLVEGCVAEGLRSVRFIVSLAVTLNIVAGIVVWVYSAAKSKESVNSLADQMMDQVKRQATAEISIRLEGAEAITATNARLVRDGFLQFDNRADLIGPAPGTERSLRLMLDQLYGFRTVTTVSITLHDGRLYGVYNDATWSTAGKWESYINGTIGEPYTTVDLQDYQTFGVDSPEDQVGLVDESAGSGPGPPGQVGYWNPYNSSEEVWYTVVDAAVRRRPCDASELQQGTCVEDAWTPIYGMYGEGESTTVQWMISQSKAAWDPDGNIWGVTTIDMALGFVNVFLERLAQDVPQMEGFVVDSNYVCTGPTPEDPTAHASGNCPALIGLTRHRMGRKVWLQTCRDKQSGGISLPPCNGDTTHKDFMLAEWAANFYPQVAPIHSVVVDKYGAWDTIPCEAQSLRGVHIDGDPYFVRLAVVNRTKLKWVIVIAVPEKVWLGEIQEASQVSLIVYVLTFSTTKVLLVVTLFIFMRSLTKLEHAMSLVEDMKLDDVDEHSVPFLTEVRRMSSSFLAMVRMLRQYRPYLPASIVNASGGDDSATGVEAPTGSVALVFTDIQSSTLLWEASPDAMDASLEDHNRVVRRNCRKYRGYEVKTIGDAFFLAFQDPIDALNFCLHTQEDLLDAPIPDQFANQDLTKRIQDPQGRPIWGGLRVRMGCHCGPVSTEVNPYNLRTDYRGQAVNKASRFESNAPPGSVAISEDCYQAIQPRKEELYGGKIFIEMIGERTMKGIQEPQRMYAVLPPSLRTRPVVGARRDNCGASSISGLSTVTGLSAAERIPSSVAQFGSNSARTYSSGTAGTHSRRSRISWGPRTPTKPAVNKLSLGLAPRDATIAAVYTPLSAKGAEVTDPAGVVWELSRVVALCVETARRTSGTIVSVTSVLVHTGWNLGGNHAGVHTLQALRFARTACERLVAAASYGVAAGRVLFGNVGSAAGAIEQRFSVAAGLAFYAAGPLALGAARSLAPAAAARATGGLAAAPPLPPFPALAAGADPGRPPPPALTAYCRVHDVWGTPRGAVRVYEPLRDALAEIDDDGLWGALSRFEADSSGNSAPADGPPGAGKGCSNGAADGAAAGLGPELPTDGYRVPMPGLPEGWERWAMEQPLPRRSSLRTSIGSVGDDVSPSALSPVRLLTLHQQHDGRQTSATSTGMAELGGSAAAAAAQPRARAAAAMGNPLTPGREPSAWLTEPRSHTGSSAIITGSSAVISGERFAGGPPRSPAPSTPVVSPAVNSGPRQTLRPEQHGTARAAW